MEECDSVTDHYPQTCAGCGEGLKGFDPNPYRHQVVDIPPIQLHIEEHRLHQLTCQHCGEKTRAVLPKEVESSGYSERVVAIVSVLSGMYRHSHRMVVRRLVGLVWGEDVPGNSQPSEKGSFGEGLEPTNNAAERAIRPAVLWRRTSFGSQSEAGSVFVARMLTVVTSLRSQNRNVLSFMTEAIRASRRGSASPSLLPQEEVLLLSQYRSQCRWLLDPPPERLPTIDVSLQLS